jgi:hypothetical protein
MNYARKVFPCAMIRKDDKNPSLSVIAVGGQDVGILDTVEVLDEGLCNGSSFLLYYFFYFGLSRLTSLQFILCHVAGFYKLTIPQSPPSHLQDNSTCNNARLEFFHKFLFQPLIQMNGA